MSDLLTAWLRTVVPGLWASLVAALVAHGLLPAELVDQANALGIGLTVVLVGVALAAWKAAWSAVELHLPPWVAAILLGSSKTPTYTAPIPTSTTPTGPTVVLPPQS